MTTFVSGEDRAWVPVSPGVEFCYLRQEKTGGMTIFVRMEAGAHAPMHEHPGGEETYLISGKLKVGENVLTPGDYLWTPPGEPHDGFAEVDTEFFVVLPGNIKMLESSGSPKNNA